MTKPSYHYMYQRVTNIDDLIPMMTDDDSERESLKKLQLKSPFFDNSSNRDISETYLVEQEVRLKLPAAWRATCSSVS